MTNELQALLTSQLGERKAREIYASVLDAALHLQESLSPAATDVPGLEAGAEADAAELLQTRLRNAARTEVLRDRLLAGALSGRELAEKLGVTSQAIDQARRADKVIALRSGGNWRYPLWQFDFSAPDPLPPHLAELAEAAGGLRLAVVRWLIEPDELFQEPPLDALRSDRWREVIHRSRHLFITAT